jgi:hypothetical protein
MAIPIPTRPNVRNCTHIKVTGQRCGSPALRGEFFCYFHTRVIKGVQQSVDMQLHSMALLEDCESIQLSIMHVVDGLLKGTLDATRARLLIQALRIAVNDELSELERGLAAAEGDLIVFLDGLNDITDSAAFRRGKSVARGERVARYLRNMERGRQLAAERQVPVVFCLQPFLLQKRQLSRIERRIVELSFSDEYPQEFVRSAYPQVRDGLRRLAGPKGAYFVDCSGALDGETATSFADIWHFPDPGHELLAECLANGLLPILARRAAE